MPEESISNTYVGCLSQNTNKPISSLKSTSKVNSKANNEKSSYDLKINCKKGSTKVQSKSLLDHISNQQSSLLLSQKQKSSILKEQSFKKASKKLKKSNDGSRSSKLAQSQK